jgi:hypothetical protein
MFLKNSISVLSKMAGETMQRRKIVDSLEVGFRQIVVSPFGRSNTRTISGNPSSFDMANLKL